MSNVIVGRKKRAQQAKAIRDENLEPPYQTLHRLHTDHTNLLRGYHELGTRAISDEILPHLTDINATNRVMKLMASDVKRVSAQGNALHATFKDKDVNTPMEKLSEEAHFECVMTVQKYADLASIHDLDIAPNVKELKDHIIEAAHRRDVAKAIAEATSDETPAKQPAAPTESA